MKSWSLNLLRRVLGFLGTLVSPLKAQFPTNTFSDFLLGFGVSIAGWWAWLLVSSGTSGPRYWWSRFHTFVVDYLHPRLYSAVFIWLDAHGIYPHWLAMHYAGLELVLTAIGALVFAGFMWAIGRLTRWLTTSRLMSNVWDRILARVESFPLIGEQIPSMYRLLVSIVETTESVFKRGQPVLIFLGSGAFQVGILWHELPKAGYVDTQRNLAETIEGLDVLVPKFPLGGDWYVRTPQTVVPLDLFERKESGEWRRIEVKIPEVSTKHGLRGFMKMPNMDAAIQIAQTVFKFRQQYPDAPLPDLWVMWGEEKQAVRYDEASFLRSIGALELESAEESEGPSL